MSKLKRNFPSFEQPGRVTFGAGSLRAIGQLEGLSETVFFVSGRPAVQDRLHTVLGKSGLDKTGLDPSKRQIKIKPSGEPTRKMIREGAAFLSAAKPRRIVAIGGGSVMDWARLSWLDSIGFLEDKSALATMARNDSRRPEFCLIPTTCGSGAEAASVAVYSNDGYKTPVNSPAIIANQVILDGHFLASLDEGTLENYLSDALSHAIESFVSIVPCYLAKEMAVSCLSNILRNYPASENGEVDALQRNERFMEAGYFGGLAAAHCSVGVVHALAHSLAPYGVSHGVANAVGLLAGIRANAQTPAMLKLVQRLGLASVDDLVDQIRPITRRAIRTEDPAKLGCLLTDESTRADLLSRTRQDICLRTNPRPLSEEEVNQFLDQARSEIEAS